MTVRHGLIESLISEINALPGKGITFVGIDGVDGAGKTVFADELADALRRQRRTVIRSGVDSFHQPCQVRHRRGRNSPEGFFRDSFNYPLLCRALFDPLRAGGNARYRVAAFDHTSDSYLDVADEPVPERAVLVFDGIFVHCPQLRPYWDYSVFLRVGFDVSVPRCAQRDGGVSPDPSAASNQRYVEGQRLYFTECQPEERATVVVDNTDLAAPFVVTQRPPR